MEVANTVKNVAVVGAGIGGLMSALALSRHGIRVTLFERDAPPAASISPENSWDWLRKGVPQSIHPHFFMGRLRMMLERRYPELVTRLMEAGADESELHDYVHPQFAHRIKPETDDACLRTINCRRTTFEMVVRAYAESLPGITIHNDARVVGLKTEPGVPAVVTGLHIKTSDGNENIAADAVIDASGRFSKLALALKASGVAMQEDQRDSGIWYFTRHYRVRKGQTYPTVFGLPGAQFDDFTVGALPADNGYFTVTFQVYREDKALASALRDPDHFQRVCELTSQVAPWVDPTRARPTSKVHGFGQMDSFWRRTVIDGQPTVLNYFCVGDSCVRSNPKYGRGCTWSAIAAHAASDLLAEPMAPADRILQYENALEDMFRADWLTMRNIDRSTEKAFEVAVGLRQPAFGEQISQRVQSFVNDAIVIEPALFRDLWRGYNGLQNMSRWTLKPINWLRLTRAWFTRSAHSALLESQRGRASHRTMSGVTQGPLEV